MVEHHEINFDRIYKIVSSRVNLILDDILKFISNNVIFINLQKCLLSNYFGITNLVNTNYNIIALRIRMTVNATKLITFI